MKMSEKKRKYPLPPFKNSEVERVIQRLRYEGEVLDRFQKMGVAPPPYKSTWNWETGSQWKAVEFIEKRLRGWLVESGLEEARCVKEWGDFLRIAPRSLDEYQVHAALTLRRALEFRDAWDSGTPQPGLADKLENSLLLALSKFDPILVEQAKWGAKFDPKKRALIRRTP